MTGAARVYVTLDELAELLQLPAGHRLEAAEELPDGYRLGLALTIVSNAAPNLPLSVATETIILMDMETYRRWGTGGIPADKYRPVRTVLREVEEPAERMRRDDHQHEQRLQQRLTAANAPNYTPAKPPVDPIPVRASAQGGDIQLVVPPHEDPVWPRFPGEALPYTGSDPGDEDGHTGGPR